MDDIFEVMELNKEFCLFKVKINFIVSILSEVIVKNQIYLRKKIIKYYFDELLNDFFINYYRVRILIFLNFGFKM